MRNHYYIPIAIVATACQMGSATKPPCDVVNRVGPYLDALVHAAQKYCESQAQVKNPDCMKVGRK